MQQVRSARHRLSYLTYYRPDSQALPGQSHLERKVRKKIQEMVEKNDSDSGRESTPYMLVLVRCLCVE